MAGARDEATANMLPYTTWFGGARTRTSQYRRRKPFIPVSPPATWLNMEAFPSDAVKPAQNVKGVHFFTKFR